jgi:hypothetical protein
LPFPQALCGSFVLACPGGEPPLFGHGGRAFALAPAATVGFGVGLAVGLGVGLGVGAGVDRAVGRGVWAGVGAAVGFAGSAGDATAGVEAKAEVALALTRVADGVTDGVAVCAGPDGVTDGAWDGVSPAGGDCVVSALGVPALVGDATGTTAIWLGPPLAIDRRCSSNPPIPKAIVARTIFRTPRLRMSRAR